MLLQAFLQQIVNSIERKYGLGKMCTDRFIVWPQGERERKFVIECKCSATAWIRLSPREYVNELVTTI